VHLLLALRGLAEARARILTDEPPKDDSPKEGPPPKEGPSKEDA
jgi:hypothetical protein